MNTSSPVIKAIALKTSLSRIEVRNLRISELVQVLPEGYTHAPRPTDVSSSPTVAHRCDERRGCIWFTKERKKERKKRKEGKKKKKTREERRKNPSFCHSFAPLYPLLGVLGSRERRKERGSLRRIDKKRIPTPAQEGGPSLFKRTQPLCR